MRGKIVEEYADANSKFWSKMGINGATLSGVFSTLDAIQEGIMIADLDGWVHYVNRAFTLITDVDQEGRVGKKIHEVSPGCPLAQVLETRKYVCGIEYKMSDANTETVCDASPIFVDGEMIGGVVLFQDVTEAINLSKKLDHSRRTINLLNNKLSGVTTARYSFDDLIGESPLFMQSINKSKRASKTDSTVLIIGETGTGKELFAHSIHECSNRAKKPFIKLNCASIPDNLLESEFFGYEKGSFTGADKDKVGMFELADDGTIFLDEIGEMSLPLQAKILRVLEEGEMYRIGGVKPIYVDVRIISATNRDLYKLVEENKFRSDLFYRLNVMNIEIPPLRDRVDDIELLANHLLLDLTRRIGKQVSGFSDSAIRILKSHYWPGNVRELRNCIEKAIIMSDGRIIEDVDVEFIVNIKREDGQSDKIVPFRVMEQELIVRALQRYGQNIEGKTMAAEVLGISLRTLYNKINLYGLN